MHEVEEELVEHELTGPAVEPVQIPVAAGKSPCPYCREPDYRAPGPCRRCGVTGYPGETPLGSGKIQW